MRWSRAVPAATTVIILVAAAVAYGQIIPVTHVERGRLSRLVITQAPSGFPTKPASAGEIPVSDNPFTRVQSAGKTSPNATGSYSVQWSASTSSTTADVIFASLLPTQADATGVEGEAKTTYVEAKSLASDGYTLKSSFPLTSVPGASTATFTSTAKGNTPVAIAVYRVGRVVVVAFGQQATAVKATTAAEALAVAEYQHLALVAPGFSLVKTTRPLTASIVYSVVAVVLALFGGFLVISINWWRRRRTSKEAARLEAIRQAQERDRRRRAARRSGHDLPEAH